MNVAWKPFDTAPKDDGHYEGQKYIPSARILIRFGDEAVSVAYYSAYHDIGGRGANDPVFPWIEPCSGEALNLHFTTPPSHWMALSDLGEPA